MNPKMILKMIVTRLTEKRRGFFSLRRIRKRKKRKRKKRKRIPEMKKSMSLMTGS